MESLIHERVGAQFRSTSAPRAGSSSAPATPKGGSGSSASLGGRPGSASKRLSKEAEHEMMRRLYGKSWRPDRNSNLSGVEQLKKRLETSEKKLKEAAKPKAKRYQTREELEEATKAMFERGACVGARAPQPWQGTLAMPPLAAKSSRTKLDAFIEKKQDEQRQSFASKSKSSSSALQRDVRLQQLSMPLRKPPRMPPKAFDDRPAWFAGKPRAAPQPGSARAVH